MCRRRRPKSKISTRDSFNGRVTFLNDLLILPEQDVIVSFTSMQDETEKRIVWGCWIREEADSVVYTALRTAKAWRRGHMRFEVTSLLGAMIPAFLLGIK